MSCKDYIYTKCLLHTDKEFKICPVEEAKKKKLKQGDKN